MLKVYTLRRLRNLDTNTDFIEGQEAITNALVEDSDDPALARVVCEEVPLLDGLALDTEPPTARDIEQLHSMLKESKPPRNIYAEVDSILDNLEAIKSRLGG